MPTRDQVMRALSDIEKALGGGDMFHVKTLEFMHLLATRGFLAARPMTRISREPPATVLVDWNTQEYAITELGTRELTLWRKEKLLEEASAAQKGG